MNNTTNAVPIKGFCDGLVETKSNVFVKIMELSPIPFFLKKEKDRARITDAFAGILKASPDYLHFKTFSTYTNLSEEIQNLDNLIQTEENTACRNMGKEYRALLKDGAENGLTHRFFLSFPYQAKSRFTSNFHNDAVSGLDQDEKRLAGLFSEIGNDLLNESGQDARNEELFYALFHRAKKPCDFPKRGKNEPIDEYLSPSYVNYKDARYLEMGGTYYSFLYIPGTGYNPNVLCGWLDSFISFGAGIDVDVFLQRMPRESVIHSIRRNIGRSQVSMSDTREFTDSYDNASSSCNSGLYLKDGLNAGEDFYYMATILTVTGFSKEEVSYKKQELISAARRMDVTLHENIFLAEDTFAYTLPTAFYDDNFMQKMKRNILTDGAVSLYPFTTFELMDKDGLYLADSADNSPVLIDLFNRRKFTNPHVFICGETGAGKTITLMLMALRARIKKMPIFLLAPEKQDEFRRLCNAVGGQFVSLGAGSPERINILEVRPLSEDAKQARRLIDGSFTESSLLSEKIALVLEFLTLYITDISIEEKQLLNEALIRTYTRFGITFDNDSIWQDQEKITLRKMPILSDLVEELEKTSDTQRLARVVKLLTTGAGAHFNGETNVDVKNDFFVIGLEHNTKEMLGLSVYLAMEYCWSKIKEDRTKKKFLFIDEWWVLAFNKIAAEKSLEISKLARAFSCSMVLATQQMSDILAIEDGKYGNAVLNNCATKLLMSMKEKDLQTVADMIDLSGSECAAISRFKPGNCLLVSSDIRLMLKVKPSETEKLLTFTDTETLKKYAELQSRKETAENCDLSGLFTELEEETFEAFTDPEEKEPVPSVPTPKTKDTQTQFLSLEEYARSYR